MMQFLQPIMLWGIPLVGLPILIHLINQRRYQTLPWGAMRFLLAANKMSRGYARLRQWLILACRTLAIAGLIFAASRPLATGSLAAWQGGRTDTTIILLDRSPSMGQRNSTGQLSKLDDGIAQLVDALQRLGSNHWVLIESNRCQPQTLDNIQELLKRPDVTISSTSADIPKMLEAAIQYLEQNKAGKTEIFICSDVRQFDWQHQSVRWSTMRDRILAFPQSVRVHLFAYTESADSNLSLRILDVERTVSESGSELSLDFRVTREGSTANPIPLPVQFEIGGVRSEIQVELVGTKFEQQGHRVPIGSSLDSGWGRVSLPADLNRMDNEYFFVFDKPAPRHGIIVTEDPEGVHGLRIATEVAPDTATTCQVEVIAPHQLDGIAWEQVSLILWQAPLPDAAATAQLDPYLQRGGQIMFFPPDAPEMLGSTTDPSFRGIQWKSWTIPTKPVSVTSWTMDHDLLANAASGISLPLGELLVTRFAPPEGESDGELVRLASLDGNIPLLSRLPSPTGGVYFCSTTSKPTDSNFVSHGVGLYVMVQRALAQGAAVLGNARQVWAGAMPATAETATWQSLTPSPSLSTDYPFHQGVYQADTQIVAVNRTVEEDQGERLSDEQIQSLFQGLDFTLARNEIGSGTSLVSEIWRAFLITMVVALLAEALLCVPRRMQLQVDKNSILQERHARQSVVKEMQEVLSTP